MLRNFMTSRFLNPVIVESNFPESTISELKNKNYIIDKVKQHGRIKMILIDDNENIHTVGDDSVTVE